MCKKWIPQNEGFVRRIMQIAELEIEGSQKADLCKLRTRKHENLQFEKLLQTNLQIEELGAHGIAE